MKKIQQRKADFDRARKGRGSKPIPENGVIPGPTFDERFDAKLREYGIVREKSAVPAPKAKAPKKPANKKKKK